MPRSVPLIALLVILIGSRAVAQPAATPPPAGGGEVEKVAVLLEIKKDPLDKALSNADLDLLLQTVQAALVNASVVTDRTKALAAAEVIAKRVDRKDRFGRNYTRLSLALLAQTALGDEIHKRIVGVNVKGLGNRATVFQMALEKPEISKAIGELSTALTNLPVIVALRMPDLPRRDLIRWKAKLRALLGGVDVEEVKAPADVKPAPTYSLKVNAPRARVFPAASQVLNEEYSFRTLRPSPESISSERLDRLVLAPLFVLKLQFEFPERFRELDEKLQEYLVGLAGAGNVEAPDAGVAGKFAFDVRWPGNPLTLSAGIADFVRRQAPDLLVERRRTDEGFLYKGEKAYRVVFRLPRSDVGARVALEQGIEKLAGKGSFHELGERPAHGSAEAFAFHIRYAESWAQLKQGLLAACTAALAAGTAEDGKGLPAEFIPAEAVSGEYVIACAYKIRSEVRGSRPVKGLQAALLSRLRVVVPGERIREATASAPGDAFSLDIGWTNTPDDLRHHLRRFLEDIAPQYEAASGDGADSFVFTLAPRRKYVVGFSFPDQKSRDVGCLQGAVQKIDDVINCELQRSPSERVIPTLTLGVEFSGQLPALTDSVTSAVEGCLEKDGRKLHVACTTRGTFMHFAVQQWNSVDVEVGGAPELLAKVGSKLLKELTAREDVKDITRATQAGKLVFKVESSAPVGKLGIDVHTLVARELSGSGVVELDFDSAARRVELTLASEQDMGIAFTFPAEQRGRKVEWIRSVEGIVGLSGAKQLPTDDASELKLSVKRAIPETECLVMVRKQLDEFFGPNYTFDQQRTDDAFRFTVNSREKVKVQLDGLSGEQQKEFIKELDKTPELKERSEIRVSENGKSSSVDVEVSGGVKSFLPKALSLLGSLTKKRVSYEAPVSSEVKFDVGQKAAIPQTLAVLQTSTRLNDRFRRAMVLMEDETGVGLVVDAQESTSTGGGGAEGGLALCPESSFAKAAERGFVKGFLGGSDPVHLSFVRYAKAPGYVWAAVTNLPAGTESFPVARKSDDPIGEAVPKNGRDVIFRDPAMDADPEAGNAYVFVKKGLSGVRDLKGVFTDLTEDFRKPSL